MSMRTQHVAFDNRTLTGTARILQMRLANYDVKNEIARINFVASRLKKKVHPQTVRLVLRTLGVKPLRHIIFDQLAHKLTNDATEADVRDVRKARAAREACAARSRFTS